MTAIEIKDLSFSYDKDPFIQDVNLEVAEKDFIGLIGPNGGGKTTIIKLILGILKPDSGSIRIFGEPPKKGRRHIGYLSQFTNIDFEFPITVWEIVLQSRLSGFMKRYSKEDESVAKRALGEVDLWVKRDRNLSELSGGEKQRVFIARALASEPKILVLDEPMSNVDMRIQESLYKLLKKLNKRMAHIPEAHNGIAVR